MQAEIAHHTHLAAETVLAFPVRRLRGIEVARVEKARANLQNPPKRARRREPIEALRSGQKGEFRRYPHKPLQFYRFVTDPSRRRQIDAEGFLRQKVLTGAEDIEVNRFVQMVRHGDVNDIDVGPGQQFAVVRGEATHARDLTKPREHLGLHIAHGDQFRLHRKIHQGEPPRKGRRGLAPHEAAANNADPNRRREVGRRFHVRRFSTTRAPPRPLHRRARRP